MFIYIQKVKHFAQSDQPLIEIWLCLSWYSIDWAFISPLHSIPSVMAYFYSTYIQLIKKPIWAWLSVCHRLTCLWPSLTCLNAYRSCAISGMALFAILIDGQNDWLSRHMHWQSLPPLMQVDQSCAEEATDASEHCVFNQIIKFKQDWKYHKIRVCIFKGLNIWKWIFHQIRICLQLLFSHKYVPTVLLRKKFLQSIRWCLVDNRRKAKFPTKE